MSEDRPRIGISACLLGEPVRFDGSHKCDPFLVRTFGPHVEWVPVCPEVEAGLGTPRETMRLVLGRSRDRERGERIESDSLAMVTVKSGRDVTEIVRTFSIRRVKALAGLMLSGFVLKKDSPSCGMERVKVYGGGRTARRAGRGLFAEALMARLSNLPVEEEGRLSDPRFRENFVERVFAYQRLRHLFDGGWSVGDLARFHTAHKVTLMAHSPTAYATLGRLVARGREQRRRALETEYEAGLMRALAVMTTPRRHANALQYMLGYFKKTLDAGTRDELLSVVEAYRVGRVPLVVPMTLMRHHVRRVGVPYLEDQVYLEPNPRELSLCHHA